ncbi:MAG TPA: nitroreductase family protein, partial [Mycobacterium sp.]|nr:nitroreductase family protein [Mycobacterium sp.]
QLSFSEDELRQKKTGLLDSTLPPWLRVPAHTEGVSEAMPLHRLMAGCPALLMVFYDARKRAPASEGDVLGMMSLGCVLENMWLMAQSLGLGFQALSVFSGPPVEQAVKNLLAVPGRFKIAFAARLGYPIAPGSYVRVRRAVAEFTHRNRFGNRGLGGPHRQLGAEAAEAAALT